MAYSDLAASILNSTNYHRSHHRAEPLSWNDTLASYAQDYSNNCLWKHSGGPYGENLAEGFSTASAGVDAWARESQLYDYETGRFSEATGHFTQLVWRATTQVGCGATLCNASAATAPADAARGWYLVCEYSARGNVIGDFGPNVQTPGMSDDGTLGVGSAAAAGRGMGGRWRWGWMSVGLIVACLQVW